MSLRRAIDWILPISRRVPEWFFDAMPRARQIHRTLASLMPTVARHGAHSPTGGVGRVLVPAAVRTFPRR